MAPQETCDYLAEEQYAAEGTRLTFSIPSRQRTEEEEERLGGLVDGPA